MYTSVANTIRHIAICIGLKIATECLINQNEAPQITARKIIKNQSAVVGCRVDILKDKWVGAGTNFGKKSQWNNRKNQPFKRYEKNAVLPTYLTCTPSTFPVRVCPMKGVFRDLERRSFSVTVQVFLGSKTLISARCPT